MSSYIPGDPAGIYSMGRGAGLMTTPRAAVPGYGAVSDIPGGWAALLTGAALGGLIDFAVIYGVSRVMGASKPGKIALWSALALVGIGTVMSAAALSVVPTSTTSSASSAT